MTRSSTSSKSASTPTIRPCARLSKPTSPPATRSPPPAPCSSRRSRPVSPPRATTSPKTAPPTRPANPTTYSDLVIAGQASWEPDLWGRIRRTVEAARSNAQASAADQASIDLSLHAEMAADYFQLRGLDAESKLLQATVADLEHQLDLTQRLLAGGIGTEVDVAQARTQLETVRAQLVDVGVARAQYEHAIGTIANLNLSSFTIPPAPLVQSQELTLPKVPVGVPSQLLERRPDIAAAERRAAAANAQIGIAVSAFYPTITLNGTGGFESEQRRHMDSRSQRALVFRRASSGTPLRRRPAPRPHRRRPATATKPRPPPTVPPFSPPSTTSKTSSPASESSRRNRASEQRAVASAQHSYDLSNQRYKGGVTSYLEVLTAESALLQNQRASIDLQTRQFVASVGLVRALGGSWDSSQLPK